MALKAVAPSAMKPPPTGLPWLLTCLRLERRTVMAATAAMLAGQMLALLVPWATWLITDRALPEGSHRLLVLALLGLGVIALHGLAFDAFSDLLQRTLSQRLRLRANAMVFEALLHATTSVVSPRSLGDSRQLMASAETVAGAALGIGLAPAVGIAGAGCAWGALHAFAPAPAAVLLLAALVFLAAVIPLARANARHQAEVVQLRGARQSALAEFLQGAATLRAENAESVAARRWLGRLTHEESATLRQVQLGLWLDLFIEGVQQASRLGWLCWGAWACLGGHLSLGQMLAGSLLVEQITRQAIGLGHSAIAGSGLAEHWRRVDAALSVPSSALPPPIRTAAPDAGEASAPALRIDDACARYGEADPCVVENCTLHVRVGAQVVLTGPSGAGKTSLLRLAAGLLPCESGAVEIFGRPTGPRDARVGYLPQNAILFEGSIADNLRWLAGTSQQEILRSAHITGLEDWVRTLPMGYATRVASCGGVLSGGQRQLILMTGVLASDRSLLLLDEPMSHLDSRLRHRILGSGLLRDRTSVIISHDDCAS